MIVEILLLGWLLYGNILYFSSGNNCNEEQTFLSYLMLALLIIGYFSMIVHCLIISCVGIIKYRRYKDKHRKQMGSVAILRSLSKSKFS
jgi:hypothetical protein